MSCDIDEEIRWLQDDIQVCKKALINSAVKGRSVEALEIHARINADEMMIGRLEKMKKGGT